MKIRTRTLSGAVQVFNNLRATRTSSQVRMRRRPLYLTVLVASVIGLVACDPPNEIAQVQVVYEQLANFQVYYLAPDAQTSHGAGDGMFVLYKITKIVNNGSAATLYTFDKHNVSAVLPDQISNEEPAGDSILLGPKLTMDLAVQPGQTVNEPGCIIKHVLTSNPQSLANTSALVDLIHQLNPSQPVSINRKPGNTTTALLTNALPSTLQSRCS